MSNVKDLGGTHQVHGLIDESSYDSDAELDTGVKVKDVVKEAAVWWDSKGRDLMNAHRFSESVGGKGISADPNHQDFIPSGITRGLPWDELTKEECVSIVKNYHHQMYRKPMQEVKDACAGIIG